MKVALQISGRLRFTEQSLTSLLASIIDIYSPDVFCSFWEPSNKDTVREWMRWTTPTLLELENQSEIRPYLTELFQFNVHDNMPSMSYKFHRSSMLRKSYELSNNVQYTHIIQARSDNLFFEKLNHNFDNRTGIWCSNQSLSSEIDSYISPRMVDNFYLGDTKSMDTAASTFWHLRKQAIEYNKKNLLHHIRIPEIIQSQVWQDLNIEIHSLPGGSPVGNFWYDIDRSSTTWS